MDAFGFVGLALMGLCVLIGASLVYFVLFAAVHMYRWARRWK